jgi:hypothetical protein
MIKINKGPEPAFLIDENGRWHKENLKAQQHYIVDGKTTAFPFKAYGDKRLKAELDRYFPKCAYCELRYKSGQDGDIEHFRPKGRVAGKVPPPRVISGWPIAGTTCFYPASIVTREEFINL